MDGKVSIQVSAYSCDVPLTKTGNEQDAWTADPPADVSPVIGMLADLRGAYVRER